MSDFCRQCSIDLFGEDIGDFLDPQAIKDNRRGFFSIVLCEDCGPCQVDHLGTCISRDCLKHHGYDGTPDKPQP